VYKDLLSSHGEREGVAHRALLVEGATQAPEIGSVRRRQRSYMIEGELV
jgi:hypothetical protein